MDLHFNYYCVDCGAPTFSGDDETIDNIREHIEKYPSHWVDATISKASA